MKCVLIGRVRDIVEDQWDKWLGMTNELDLLNSLEYAIQQ